MNRLVLPLLASLGLAASSAVFAAEQEAEPAAEKPNYKLVTVAEGLEFP